MSYYPHSPHPSQYAGSHHGHGVPVMYGGSAQGGYLSPQPVYDDGFGGGYGAGQPYVVSSPSSRSHRHHSSQPYYVSTFTIPCGPFDRKPDCYLIRTIVTAVIAAMDMGVLMVTVVNHVVMAIAIIIDHLGNASCDGLALAVTDRVAIVAEVQAGACLVAVAIALDMSTRGQDFRWISRADHCTRYRAHLGCLCTVERDQTFFKFLFGGQRSVLLRIDIMILHDVYLAGFIVCLPSVTRTNRANLSYSIPFKRRICIPFELVRGVVFKTIGNNMYSEWCNVKQQR